MGRDGLVTLLATMLFFAGGCMSEPGIDKQKFSEADRAAREMNAALSGENACRIPEALLEQFSSALDTAKAGAASKPEQDVVAAFKRLQATYQDGQLLCRCQTQLNRFHFVPAGRIYVFQQLDPIVDKYALPTESHLYTPTGVTWRSIAGDSIKVIWKSAENQLRNIENMVNYN